MRRLVTADQMRAIDAATIADHGMPAGVLMENAGAALAEAAEALAGPRGRFFVLCGRGNNGGDGLVAARRLLARERTVFVELVGGAERLDGEPKRNLLALQSAGLGPAQISEEVQAGPGDVVIDALFGTGLSRAPEGAYAEAIARIRAWRAAGAKVVAADIPSGLSSDTGQPFEPCVEADVTTSFGLLKVGQALEPGRSICGETREIDIGIPAIAAQVVTGPAIWLLDEDDARARIPKRRRDAHKGTFGHVLVVAGSWGKTGAAAMTGLGALRSGAGLVTVATRPEALVPVMAHAPELMGVELLANGPLGLGDLNPLLEAADGKSAIVIGPGIPRGEETGKLIGALLEEISIPCVLDADALNAVAARPDALRQAKCPLILTPHPGEMARLTGKSTKEVQHDRVGVARRVAAAHQAVVVLKGASTVIALEDGTVFINPSGNPGMATGGSGDVLSGVLGALLAQGLSPDDAAVAGVFAHGLAGDLAARRTGQLGLIATDLLAGLCEVWVRWGR
ncbi:MAG: NAD(P)H-hydrate dehydratase [Myxococcaceae bacterium]|nr:NAD(P)H-hydrate dehydratase [Myxococcaceae bacterium]